MNEFDSIKKLVRADGFLYTKDVVGAGIRKEKLKYFLDGGDLIREARGIYAIADDMGDEFALLQARCRKGVFSYGTALYFHGMSDRSPHVISMTVPRMYNVYYLQKDMPTVRFHRTKAEWWEIGITEIQSPQGGRIRVYDKERCICDMIKDKKNTDPQVFSQAVKEYFASPKRDCIRLMEYGTRLGIGEKIEEYMEMLL